LSLTCPERLKNTFTMPSLKAAALALAFGSVFPGSNGARKAKRRAPQWEAVELDGWMNITRPAFLHKFGKTIYVSQFGRKRPGFDDNIPLPPRSEISTIQTSDIASALRSGKMRNFRYESYVSTDLDVKWPNKLSHAPPEVAAAVGSDVLVIPDGFLVPFKRAGAVYLTKDGRSLSKITNTPRSWPGSPEDQDTFYHEVEWHDFDGDGVLDILVPRARVTSIFGIPQFNFRGELMWYRNPGYDKMFNQEWEETKIVDGPDVICRSRPYRGGLAVFCSQFWDEGGKLWVHYLNQRAELQWSRMIDAEGGKLFSVEPVDLDGDGVEELLVTNHQETIDESAVFAYEVPWGDLQKGEYKKHVLAINIFYTVLSSDGVASPGFARAFHPQVGTTTGPKHIIVAGDGSLDVWHLRPTGERFGYEARQVAEPRGTTGELLLDDFDGDGIMDVLVPDNDNWDLRLITFRKV